MANTQEPQATDPRSGDTKCCPADPTASGLQPRWKLWLRRAEAISLFAGSLLLAAWVVRERVYVRAELGHIGIFSYPVAVLLLVIVASAPFSVTDALAVMNGVIFGPVGGSLVNLFGIIGAAIAGYYIARRTSSLLELDKTLERLPAWVRHFKIGSFAFLLTVRILPGIGGTVATQVAAAKRVPLLIHVLAMCTIAVPICTALAIGGDSLSSAIESRVTEPLHRYAEQHHMHISPPWRSQNAVNWSFANRDRDRIRCRSTRRRVSPNYRLSSRCVGHGIP